MTDNLHVGFFAVACAVIAGFSVLPMDSLAQMVAVTVLLGVMSIARTATHLRNDDFFRLLALFAGLAINLRYLAWRAEHTLVANDMLSLAGVYLVFAAEIYSSALHFMGAMVNATPLKRPLLSLSDLPPGAHLPSVDVMIPSYNESPELLEITLRAALMMRYPENKLRVCLLDDGGTEEKIGNADPASAERARERRKVLQALCKRLGAHYITRARNERAKAGNVNNGLEQTDGELIVILDADHVPTTDFLDHTVPWFVRHDDVFLVQTPHFMINPDPVERNLLQSFGRMPSENDMFYQTIQRGLDFWSASFFCGSAAVLRRRHIEEIGGLAGDSITEDAECAMDLHRLGYRSIYVDRPMVAGLAPETFTGFIIQRMRWAQGMTQILLLKRPFMDPGLSWHQRIGYMSSILFWLFPFARLIFLLSPLAYLLFGLEVYNASMREMLAFTLPHIIAIYMISGLLFGRTRWPLVSEIYEVLQCLFSLVAIIKVLANPRKPAFMVTPKGDMLDEDFISPLARPFYIVFAFMLLGFAAGAYRWWHYPLTRDLTTVVLLWNFFNFASVFAALGVLLERRQQRASPRMPVKEQATIRLPDNGALACTLVDLSAGGVRLQIDDARPDLNVGETLWLDVYSAALGHRVNLPIEIRAVTELRGQIAVGGRFVMENSTFANQAVALSMGDSGRWLYFQERRWREVSVVTALRTVLRQIWMPVFRHLLLALRTSAGKFLKYFRRPRPMKVKVMQDLKQ